MQRWLRILVLVLSVMPLAMPVAQWSRSAQCVTQMTLDHACCPQHSEIAAPSCCNAKADSYLSEDRVAADAVRISTTSQAVLPIAERLNAVRPIEARTAYISILIPALILRT